MVWFLSRQVKSESLQGHYSLLFGINGSPIIPGSQPDGASFTVMVMLDDAGFG